MDGCPVGEAARGAVRNQRRPAGEGLRIRRALAVVAVRVGGVVERIVASLEEAVVIRVAVLWGVFSVSIRVLGGLGAEAYPGKWASATCCECKCGGSCEVGVDR